MNLDTRKKLLLPILLMSTVLIFTRFALISFLAYLLILGIVSSKEGRGWIQRTVWAYIFFFCLLTLFSSFGSFMGLKITPTDLLLLLAIFTWIAATRQPMKVNTEKGRSWPGVVAALGICIYINIPVLSSFSHAAVLRYSAKTDDDISHIARIEAIRSVGGPLYQRGGTTSQFIDPGTTVSPQGWHVNGAFVESLIIKLTGSDSIDTRLLSYLLYKTFWLFITVFLVYMFLKKIMKAFFRLSGVLFDVLSAIGVAAVSILFLATLYGYGFQNFIASIALICASLVLAIQYIENKNPHRKRIYLLALAILTTTSIYVWTLSGVVVGFITLAMLVKESLARYKIFISWRQWLTIAALVVLAALPIYLLVKPGSERGLKTINSEGAVPPIRIIAVVLLFLLTLLAIRKLKPKKETWLLSLISLTALEFFIVALYQQVTLGEQRYYAIKLAFIVAIITSITSLAVILRLLKSYNFSGRSIVVTYIAALAILPVALGLDLRKSAYPLKDSAPIKTATAQKILNLSSSDGNKNAIIYTTNKEESYLATKLWSSVNAYNTPQRKVLLDRMFHEIYE